MKNEKFSRESEPENPERNKRRQSIKFPQKLSKIIGSDVRHGTKMGRKGYKMERLCNVN